jgi:hypothetical protein
MNAFHLYADSIEEVWKKAAQCVQNKIARHSVHEYLQNYSCIIALPLVTEGGNNPVAKNAWDEYQNQRENRAIDLQ